MFVHAVDLAPVEVGSFFWAGGETGPVLSLPIGRTLRAFAGVSAIVPITRRQAFFRGRPDAVWEQEVVGDRADIGLDATF